MNDYMLIRKEDLVNNPTARIPVCLCLDVSGSMIGEPINELNKGVNMFYDSIRDDEVASFSAEISIVTFGKSGAECVADFASLAISPNPPILTANGFTPMGEAVNMALDNLKNRKQEYKDAGVDYYQPWLVLMTDGCPNGNFFRASASNSADIRACKRKKINCISDRNWRRNRYGCNRKVFPKKSTIETSRIKIQRVLCVAQ